MTKQVQQPKQHKVFLNITCIMLNILCFYTSLTILIPVKYQVLALGNSVGPDQLASQKPADLDLQCFQKKEITVLSMVLVNQH